MEILKNQKWGKTIVLGLGALLVPAFIKLALLIVPKFSWWSLGGTAVGLIVSILILYLGLNELARKKYKKIYISFVALILLVLGIIVVQNWVTLVIPEEAFRGYYFTVILAIILLVVLTIFTPVPPNHNKAK